MKTDSSSVIHLAGFTRGNMINFFRFYSRMSNQKLELQGLLIKVKQQKLSSSKVQYAIAFTS